MTRSEFHERHSEIIEYYQYIEMHLRGICAVLLASEEKSWFDQLDEHNTDTLGALITKIQSLQIQKSLDLFSPEDLDTLNQLRKNRNYWVHQCFTDPKERLVTYNRVDTIKNIEIVKRINSDLLAAIEWNEKITEVETPLVNKSILNR